MDENPKEFLKAIDFYSRQKTFELKGENYKRIIDSSKPKEIINWYQKKSMYLVCEKKKDNALFGRKLLNDLKHGFEVISPIYRYLQKVISLAVPPEKDYIIKDSDSRDIEL
ncbi:MAG: DUF2461 family protein [Sedimentisphaerales bacterium]|nr:DUF2461 family protein [Sedimentisphaerales bacterium]